MLVPESGQDNHSDCTVPTVKHGGRRVLVLSCMNAKDVEELIFTDGTMTAGLYPNTE